MKRSLMNILSCPICRHHPLKLYVFEEKEEVVDGLILCTSCNRWYPILDELPQLLPDEFRKVREDQFFLQKWREKLPNEVLKE